MARCWTAKFNQYISVIGLAVALHSPAAWANAPEEPTKEIVQQNNQQLLGDENSDAMSTGSITKVEGASCGKGTSNLKVPFQPKGHIPEEQP